MADVRAQVPLLQPLGEVVERPRACLQLPDNRVRGVGQRGRTNHRPASPFRTHHLQQPPDPSTEDGINPDTRRLGVIEADEPQRPEARAITRHPRHRRHPGRRQGLQSHKSPTLHIFEYGRVSEVAPRAREHKSCLHRSRTRAFFECIPHDQREWCLKREELSLNSSEGIIQAYDRILLKSPKCCSIPHAPGRITDPDFLSYLAKFGEASAEASAEFRSPHELKFCRYRLLVFLGLCEVALKNGHKTVLC
jgi:hypothetical protein